MKEMKFNIFAVVISLVMTFAFATSAMAGSIDDADSDDTPDVFDNCTLIANGATPTDVCSNQIDADTDGFGNPCDTDFDNNGITVIEKAGNNTVLMPSVTLMPIPV